MNGGAVFFDLDGTLIDSKSAIAAAVNHTRCDFALAELDEAEILGYVGRGAEHLLMKSIPELPFDAVRGDFKTRYIEHCCDGVSLYPGVEETLEELKSRGWKLALNTNKPRYATDLVLERFGLARFFGAATVAGGDIADRKPSPETIAECARRLGGHSAGPGDWMVGDSAEDMLTAAAAGIGGAYCAFGFGRLGAAPFTARLERFSDLAGLLSGRPR